VSELLAIISSRELAEWEAHFGLRAEEQQQAALGATAASKLQARTALRGR
jgi:hypothetical protein